MTGFLIVGCAWLALMFTLGTHHWLRTLRRITRPRHPLPRRHNEIKAEADRGIAQLEDLLRLEAEL